MRIFLLVFVFFQPIRCTNISSYQLSLRLHGRHVCGSAPISTSVGITAAHCLQRNVLAGPYSIKAGITHLNQSGITIHVNLALIHPLYNHDYFDYDIALLFLAKHLPLSENIKLVKLPAMGTLPAAGAIGTVTGWRNGVELEAEQIPVWCCRKCEVMYGSVMTQRMFCAGFEEVGRSSCLGDGGGPFVVGGVLWGVVSQGEECAFDGHPGIYTNIAVLRDFIKEYAGL